MGHKPRVRPGLSSPEQSQDVEFTLDQQVDEGQHERDEKESGGALGPAKDNAQPQTGHKQPDINADPETSKGEKGHRGPFS